MLVGGWEGESEILPFQELLVPKFIWDGIVYSFK